MPRFKTNPGNQEKRPKGSNGEVKTVDMAVAMLEQAEKLLENPLFRTGAMAILNEVSGVLEEAVLNLKSELLRVKEIETRAKDLLRGGPRKPKEEKVGKQESKPTEDTGVVETGEAPSFQEAVGSSV
jgi:hypothetical protein